VRIGICIYTQIVMFDGLLLLGIRTDLFFPKSVPPFIRTVSN